MYPGCDYCRTAITTSTTTTARLWVDSDESSETRKFGISDSDFVFLDFKYHASEKNEPALNLES